MNHLKFNEIISAINSLTNILNSPSIDDDLKTATIEKLLKLIALIDTNHYDNEGNIIDTND